MNEKLAPEFIPVVQSIETHLLGKRHAITLTLAAFLAAGHVLLEDIPGVGKTADRCRNDRQDNARSCRSPP